MNSRSAVGWFVRIAGLVACGAAFGQPPPAAPVLVPKAGAPLTFDAGRGKIRVALVSDGLVAPWDIVFIPGTSDMLVTESNGKLRMIAGGKLVAEPVWTPPSPAGNDVTHGVVVHPDFATNRLVYVSYMKGDEMRQTMAISRGRLDAAARKLTDVREIFVADAWENARMAFNG